MQACVLAILSLICTKGEDFTGMVGLHMFPGETFSLVKELKQ